MSDKIQITPDGLEVTNDAGKRVVIRTNHGATQDAYIDLPSTGGTISTAEGATDTDEKAKVSSNDTTAGYLESKLVAGSNITLTTNNDGGNETITIASAGGVDTDEKSKVSANDTTAGYLNGKLVAGSGISFTENNNGSDETLTIASTVTDQLVKARSSDTTANYLASKLAEGTGISFNILNSGGNELISIASTVTNTDQLAKVSSNDTTAGYLNGKLVAGSGITLTEGSDGGNETLTIAASGGGGGGGSDDTNLSVTLTDVEGMTNGGYFLTFNVPSSVAEGDIIFVDYGFLYRNTFPTNGADSMITYFDNTIGHIGTMPTPTDNNPRYHQMRQTFVIARDEVGSGNYIIYSSTLGSNTTFYTADTSVYQPISQIGIQSADAISNMNRVVFDWTLGFTYKIRMYWDSALTQHLYPSFAKATLRTGGVTK